MRLQQQIQQYQATIERAKQEEIAEERLQQLREEIQAKLALIEDRTTFLQEIEKGASNQIQDPLAHTKSDALISTLNNEKKYLQLRSLSSKIWDTAKGVAKEVAIRSVSRQ